MKHEESAAASGELRGRMTRYLILCSSFLILLSVSFLSAYSSFFTFHADSSEADRLNTLSYACHYRDIDSTEYYARLAYSQSADDDARAEALNNLAFAALVRMDYRRVDSLLGEVARLTDNQVELLVAEVGQMRLCQRRSENRAFYEHREKALTHLRRINEERRALPPRLQRRMTYAESEMAIVNSTYYYYVGLERQSVEAMQAISVDEIRRDTAQYLNYLYNVGAGGVVVEGSAEQIRMEEMDCLNRCLTIARRHHYPYFEAQAKEALAEHLSDLQFAEEALTLFQRFGDIYQIAGAYRTLASCHHAQGDDHRAIDYLNLALSDQRVSQAPDLVASIREQMSVAYSAIDDKQQSDYNRNIYIDLQEQTRQDRELEARAGLLEDAVRQLNWMITAVVVAIVLLVVLLWLFNQLNRKNKVHAELDQLLEQKEEELAELRLRIERNERQHLEQRAKVSKAMGILPLIDRILYAINHLAPGNQESEASNRELDYVRELVDNINEQNDQLTRWIQLRQGELNLRVESFPLQELFDLVGHSQTAFKTQGLRLEIRPTTATVKADRALTLFMLNTLADNARKFTGRGGQVTIGARELTDSVEISVADTGRGMSEEELAHLFDRKVIVDDANQKTQSSHGFGLMNCKGIIEKYRKTSRIFSVCLLQAESERGKGSRFYFRLPKGVVRGLAALAVALSYGALTVSGQAEADSGARGMAPLDYANIYADSAYFSNINGSYERTLLFADSCYYFLNAHYQSQHPDSRLLMRREGGDGSTPAEIQWFHEGAATNYQIILDIRNESAVAALALHDWKLYTYNNKVYTQLFKEMSADNTLADYCRAMQQSRQDKHVAVVLLLVLLALVVPAYFMFYYRHRLYVRFSQEKRQQDEIERVEDELRRAGLENDNLYVTNAMLDNCLSTFKHETMYYPSRIRQLIDAGDLESLPEVVSYYRDLYSILIRQAISQAERVKPHIRPVELRGQRVLGDEHLLRYLFELVRGRVESAASDERYVTYTVGTDGLSPIDYQLCRQIVRDHGEATHRRGCGITLDGRKAVIVLPAAKQRL